ncbi:hypothetical protein GGR51DRAFT_41064 [Nemania sp. FL0031]|nr:hypothetical protein GGR51DRAFT_41064 [Nemania sp. FL0031]
MVGVVVVLIVLIAAYPWTGLVTRGEEDMGDGEGNVSLENGRVALAIRQRGARVWNGRGISRNEEKREEEQARGRV